MAKANQKFRAMSEDERAALRARAAVYRTRENLKDVVK